MCFSFTFKLNDGAELVIEAECTEDDTIIIGISCPNGAMSARRTLEAYLNFETIEEQARQEYQERLALILAERRDAGVAGEGVA